VFPRGKKNETLVDGGSFSVPSNMSCWRFFLCLFGTGHTFGESSVLLSRAIFFSPPLPKTWERDSSKNAARRHVRISVRPPFCFFSRTAIASIPPKKIPETSLPVSGPARMIRAVFLEGNSGNIDTTLFSSLPSEPIKKDVIDDFMKKGLMTGAEGFAIENASSLPLVGIEDPALYAKSLCLLQRAFRNQAATPV
jgi:hypothetical protein